MDRARVKKTCEQCGGSFESYPAKKTRFCSRKCYGEWQSEKRRGENSPSWKGGNTKKTCEQCGEEYEVRPYRRDISRFCSHDCHDKWRSENMCGENSRGWKGGKIIKTCEQCGEEYEVQPSWERSSRFCSRECYVDWQSENRYGENNPAWKGGKIIKKCDCCGEIFGTYPSLGEQRFCSAKCAGKWKSGVNSPMWKGGISFEPYCHKFNKAFKETIREKFGRVCFLCPTTEEENGRKLSVHHVNYNKDCLCDGSDCEFVPLCIRCHSKTNNSREHWEQTIMEKLEGIS